MPDNMIYWYVLFCRTGAEERLAEKLKYKLGEGYLPFVPQKTCIFRRQGQKSLFQKKCFPGYVFIESDKPAEEFMERAFPVVNKQKEAYKFLFYGDRADIAMLEEERVALSRILGNDYCIDISTGFKEGDSVKVISGALVGSESKILKLSKNRHEAVIEVMMFGTMVSVSVGLDVIEKTSD